MRLEAPESSANGTFEARVRFQIGDLKEAYMGFGRGLLFWLLGIPIPIIILLAIFWHH
jgi:hypothetical protein